MKTAVQFSRSIAFAAALAAASAALAQSSPGTPGPQTGGSQAIQSGGAVTPTGTSNGRAPTWGPQFGAHVSDMTPEHPRDHGVMFGECVSTMAVEAMAMGDDTMHEMCHAM